MDRIDGPWLFLFNFPVMSIFGATIPHIGLSGLASNNGSAKTG